MKISRQLFVRGNMIDIGACITILESQKSVEGEYFQDQENAYIIVTDVTSTYYYEFRAIVIYSVFADKCNAYILEVGDPLRLCDDPINIVKNGAPLSLKSAQLAFPKHEFDESNYGFYPTRVAESLPNALRVPTENPPLATK